jgi:Leucine-rich repeat (LRR) protein
MMSGMPSAQELNVSGLRLGSVADSTFFRLKKLRVLDLRGNSLKQLRHSALASPSALREVYLSGKRQSTDICVPGHETVPLMVQKMPPLLAS